MYDVMCTHYSVCGERFTKRNNSKGRHVEIKHIFKKDTSKACNVTF